jgi:Fe-S cluster biogenesis protein NfuA
MSFNLVLDGPAEGDRVEEHDGIRFAVENILFDRFGPFVLTSFKSGSQVFLQLKGEKQVPFSGGCDSCSSCE